ncbi:MAG: cytochrome C oxidase subunit IV family protein [Phycisphaeraceae bacterium]|nr:MAG: cytochrome C oxidase subunit IV family protein [Phycisphaeraceae bacterium]
MAHHAHPPANAPAFDEVDPHGEGFGHGHGHHITPAIVLQLILAVLLFFTALTVGLAQGEKWISAAFDVTLPHWVNVVVAMSIATIKSTLVLLYFMHLRHDNPINSIIFGFTILAFAIFLCFTFIDIGNRGYLDPVKVQHRWNGYMGVSDDGTVQGEAPPFLAAVDKRFAELKRRAMAGGASEEAALAQARKDLEAEFRYSVKGHGLPHEDLVKRLASKDLLGPEVVADIRAHAPHGHGHGPAAPTGTSVDRARPKKGDTGVLRGGGTPTDTH